MVRHHDITYLRPAGYGDELELTTSVESMRGARAIRRTGMRLLASAEPVVAVRTEWAWVRADDGRPMRLPEALLQAFAAI